MVTGVTPLVRWLQSFRVAADDAVLPVSDPDGVLNAAQQRRSAQHAAAVAGAVGRGGGAPTASAVGVRIGLGSVSASPSTSLSSSAGPGELHVQAAALLIAELATELKVMDTSSSSANGPARGSAAAKPQLGDQFAADPKHAPIVAGAAGGGGGVSEAQEREMVYNLIQTCVLLRLLGAGTDSGRLRLNDLGGLLEDAWMLSVPMNGVRVSSSLAQFRFKLLQQVSVEAPFSVVHHRVPPPACRYADGNKHSHAHHSHFSKSSFTLALRITCNLTCYLISLLSMPYHRQTKWVSRPRVRRVTRASC